MRSLASHLVSENSHSAIDTRTPCPPDLRATDHRYRETADSCKISWFILFFPKNIFDEAFYRIVALVQVDVYCSKLVEIVIQIIPTLRDRSLKFQKNIRQDTIKIHRILSVWVREICWKCIFRAKHKFLPQEFDVWTCCLCVFVLNTLKLFAPI